MPVHNAIKSKNYQKDLEYTVTNAIKSSITKLDHKISRLEMAVQEAEKRAAQKPKPAAAGTDLFSAAPNDAETRALASRLDGAIAKVEALLKEGATQHG
jgi:hypothetical protein